MRAKQTHQQPTETQNPAIPTGMPAGGGGLFEENSIWFMINTSWFMPFASACVQSLSRRYASVQLATAKSSYFRSEFFSIFHFAKTLLGFPREMPSSRLGNIGENGIFNGTAMAEKINKWDMPDTSSPEEILYTYIYWKTNNQLLKQIK